MIKIDFKDRKPIYEQLIDNIIRLILKDVYLKDDQLPSVRQLANDLTINPNTIQKAYSELERLGVIYSLKGRGSFIAETADIIRGHRTPQVLGQLEDVLDELIDLAVPQKQVIDHITTYYQAKEGRKHD